MKYSYAIALLFSIILVTILHLTTQTTVPNLFLVWSLGAIPGFLLWTYSTHKKVISEHAKTISEERMARSRAELAKRKLAHILESMNDAFLSIDHQGTITYLNKQAEEILKKSRSQLLQKNLWTEYSQFQQLPIFKHIKEVQRSGNPGKIEQFSELTNKWYEVSAYPSMDGVSLYFNDITDRKMIEKQKDEFLSIASHELKTPVTTIKAYSQILESKNENLSREELTLYTRKMNIQIEKLIKLVNDLLDISRAQLGKMEFHFDEVSVDDLVKDVVEDLQKVFTSHQIIIQGHTHKKIYADRDRIDQVIINLISNAIKYSPREKKVQIFLSSDIKNVAISIKDFGIGIPKENQQRVFERFYRVNSFPKGETYPGLGIGLYISSEIVKKHKGEVRVRSSVGQGSEFTILIPFIKQTASPKHQEEVSWTRVFSS